MIKARKIELHVPKRIAEKGEKSDYRSGHRKDGDYKVLWWLAEWHLAAPSCLHHLNASPFRIPIFTLALANHSTGPITFILLSTCVR